MVDFGISIAISYFFYQLVSVCLATFAFKNEWILKKMNDKGWIPEKLKEAVEGEGTAVHAGSAGLEHAERRGMGWWARMLGSGVCSLGKFGYWWFVFWVILSSSLMFSYMHHPHAERTTLYWGLFGGTIATAVIILFLTFFMNRPLFVRSLPFLIIQAGALAILVAGVAGE